MTRFPLLYLQVITKKLHLCDIFFRHSSKNYGLVMTGQAAAAPVIALLTEFLSPALGWLGMFFIIAGASILSCTINMRYPKHPSPKVLLERLQRPPPSQL